MFTGCKGSNYGINSAFVPIKPIRQWFLDGIFFFVFSC